MTLEFFKSNKGGNLLVGERLAFSEPSYNQRGFNGRGSTG